MFMEKWELAAGCEDCNLHAAYSTLEDCSGWAEEASIGRKFYSEITGEEAVKEDMVFGLLVLLVLVTNTSCYWYSLCAPLVQGSEW